MNGKTLLNGLSEEKNTEVVLPFYAGMYWLEIRSGKDVRREKIILIK